MRLLGRKEILEFLMMLAKTQDKGKGLDWLSQRSGEPLNILRRQVKGLRKQGYYIPPFADEPK